MQMVLVYSVVFEQGVSCFWGFLKARYAEDKNKQTHKQQRKKKKMLDTP